MAMKTVMGSLSMMLAGLTLVGCQSSDPGSGSRMLSRQDNPYARPPMNSYASTMPGNKSLAISDTNSRPGMLPSSANAVQQASAMQNSPASSSAMPTSNSSSSVSGSSVSGFDQAGSVVSRPMPDVSNTAPSGPTPPSRSSTPGGYTIPAPTSYSPPPSTTSVPTRKTGDDQ